MRGDGQRAPDRLDPLDATGVERPEITEEDRVVLPQDELLESHAQAEKASRLQVDDEDAVLHPVTVLLECTCDPDTALIIGDVVGD